MTAKWLAAIVAIGLLGCGGEDGQTAPPKAAAADQSSPSALAESIFAAARSGDLGALAAIADPVDADGDSKNVAGVARMSPEQQAEFRQYFEKGKVSGEVKIEGDRAQVPILFGPDGTKTETFVMVKRDGRWYLQSF